MKLTKYCVAVVAMLCLSSAAQAQRSQGHILRVGETLASGNWLTSQNGVYELHMQQADGNLVLYRQGNGRRFKPAGWNSGPKGGGAYVRILEDGRLVMWKGTSWMWEWNKAGAWSNNTRLVLGPDGSLKIYQDGPFPVFQRREDCQAGVKEWGRYPVCGPNESPAYRDFKGEVVDYCGPGAGMWAGQPPYNGHLCYDTPADNR